MLVKTLPNARVKRKHRYILEIGRSLMIQSSFPIHFWGDYILTTTYIKNILPNPFLQNLSPNQILFGTASPYTHLKAFGCLCYISTATELLPINFTPNLTLASS